MNDKEHIDLNDILGQPAPSYLFSKRKQASVLIFMILFALLVVNFFIYPALPNFIDRSGIAADGPLPNGMGNTPFMHFVWSLVIVIFGVLVIVLSHTMQYFVKRRHTISILGYSAWVLGELLLMSIIFAVCVFCIRIDNDFMHATLVSLAYASFIYLVSFFLCVLYMSNYEKKAEIKKLKSELDSVVTEKAATKDTISFYDERGEMQLSIAKEHFLFVESADNYVNVWYLKNALPRKLMLRMTMSRMEEQLAGTSAVRCHRSYIINMEQVKVLQRDKDGFYAEMGIEGVPDLPVSRTYSDAVTTWLSLQ